MPHIPGHMHHLVSAGGCGGRLPYFCLGKPVPINRRYFSVSFRSVS